MAVCDLWLSRGNLFGMLVLGSAAIAWWALASQCRTATWYYMRCNDVHGTPLLFPCPRSEINQCERVLGEIRTRMVSGKALAAGVYQQKQCEEPAASALSLTLNRNFLGSYAAHSAVSL